MTPVLHSFFMVCLCRVYWLCRKFRWRTKILYTPSLRGIAFCSGSDTLWGLCNSAAIYHCQRPAWYRNPPPINSGRSPRSGIVAICSSDPHKVPSLGMTILLLPHWKSRQSPDCEAMQGNALPQASLFKGRFGGIVDIRGLLPSILFICSPRLHIKRMEGSVFTDSPLPG